MQSVELAAGNDRLPDAGEIGGVMRERVGLRDHHGRCGRRREERGMDRGVVPRLVRPQFEQPRLPALPRDRRRIDTAPGLVMTGVTSEIADRAREVLEGLGATVTVSEPELFAHRF